MATVPNTRWAYHVDSNHTPVQKADRIRLHLGCGVKYIPGWINVDNHGKVDLHADITRLPYEDNFADQIMAIHVWEHIWLCESERVLTHWYAKLKPGGELILEMPDFRKVIQFAHEEMEKFDGEDVSDGIWLKSPKYHPFFTIFSLFGDAPDPTRPEDLHKWGWTFKTLAPCFRKVGFSEIREEPAKYHFPQRDFRIVGVK